MRPACSRQPAIRVIYRMNPALNITFTHQHGHEDMALLIEAIAGEIRLGSRSGTAPEYSWSMS